MFHILYKIKNREPALVSAVRCGSTGIVRTQPRWAASSRDAGLPHSIQPVTS